jgi:hypothetical protein
LNSQKYGKGNRQRESTNGQLHQLFECNKPSIEERQSKTQELMLEKQLDYNMSRNNDLKTIHMGLVNAITNFTNVMNLAFANISNANMIVVVPTQQEQPNNKNVKTKFHSKDQ